MPTSVATRSDSVSRTRLSYLPDVLIFDPVVKQNFDCYGHPGPTPTSPCGDGFAGNRLAYRFTGTFTLPEIGLGPLVRATIDGVAVHNLEHDFVLDKYAGIPTVYLRPFRELQFALSQTVEHNQAHIFAFNTIQGYLTSVAAGQSGNGDLTDLSTLLRFPDVPSLAFAQRFVVTWDRRDNTFNPHKGTLFVSGIEHTDWFGQQPECTGNLCSTPYGHTVKFTETIAAYLPRDPDGDAGRGAAHRGQHADQSQRSPAGTRPPIPIALFFLGGVQSMRGYLQDSMVTQEDTPTTSRRTTPRLRTT